MAKIGWKGLLTSAAYGGLDLGIELGTAKQAPVIGTLQWGDIERFAVVALSGVANIYTSMGTGITEPLFYSSLPLAIRSAYRLAANATSVPGYSPANGFVPIGGNASVVPARSSSGQANRSSYGISAPSPNVQASRRYF